MTLVHEPVDDHFFFIAPAMMTMMSFFLSCRARGGGHFHQRAMIRGGGAGEPEMMHPESPPWAC